MNDQFKKWFHTSSNLPSQFEKLRRLLEITEGELTDGIYPSNWEAIQRLVTDANRQALFSLKRFEDMGLTPEDLPVVPGPLVAIGTERFTSVLAGLFWSAQIWMKPGGDLLAMIRVAEPSLEMLGWFQRFFCLIDRTAKVRIELRETGITEVHNWIKTPIKIDDRICPAGLLVDLVAWQAKPKRDDKRENEKKFVPYEHCLRHEKKCIQDAAAYLNRIGKPRGKAKALKDFFDSEREGQESAMPLEEAKTMVDTMKHIEQKGRAQAGQ
ncbi:MAG: hypothetical protein Q8M16_24035 [Pirellulaceae bacterium]|nr:hypothetical protein [Pirellulaceae bacterium]